MKEDRSQLFEAFCGELVTAPMVVPSPVNMECRLHQTPDLNTDKIFFCEIVASYSDQSVMTDGNIDLEKVRPMLFDMHRKECWKLGRSFAKCWNMGKKLKRRYSEGPLAIRSGLQVITSDVHIKGILTPRLSIAC